MLYLITYTHWSEVKYLDSTVAVDLLREMDVLTVIALVDFK